ncbi:hypothetical protein C8A00DRAFT_31560 [Chaetomidium leptoderma]|uniref:Uncharacterized protein n=1 Tax=Chaetomidium leptoderma TaxID=669021 RepID=A0AAN6VSQ7_9PEZI|nr:hypothetical protein C8A00DRAFT_31560 [Chaetomidium leptoderma]
MSTHSPNSSVKAAAPSETLPSKPLPDSTDRTFAGLVEDLKFNEDLKVESVEIDASTGEKQTRKMLKAVNDKKNFLPGQPRIRLDDNPKDDQDQLLAYLHNSHNTDGLDDLLRYTRYIFVQMPSHSHIMALHHQAAHSREIKVTESPGLHLVWYHELIFIKPIPAYFYSPAFWEYLENADGENQALYMACVGFMRSYYMLIRHEIDFKEACRLGLIPKKGKGKGRLPTYEEWCTFIVPFARVGDGHVNRRYHYGELRLTRLNRAAGLLQYGLTYYHIGPLEWSAFMELTLARLITIFAVCSVVLSSMQVVLGAITMVQTPPDGLWPKFVDASIWFSVIVMASVAAFLVITLLQLGNIGLQDLFRATHARRRKKRGPPTI